MKSVSEKAIFTTEFGQGVHLRNPRHPPMKCRVETGNLRNIRVRLDHRLHHENRLRQMLGGQRDQFREISD